MYVIIAILMFGILIAVHELGHFAVAKLVGVRVEEYSIGMGPALWKKQKGETLYALRAIPFGGYCAMTGEDGETDDPRALSNQKLLPKLGILCAGSFMNFVLGVLLVFLLTLSLEVDPRPVLAEFMDGCPYESAEAFQVGDRFYEVDGERVLSSSDLTYAIAEDGQSHDFTVIRDGKKVEIEDLTLTMREYEGYDTPKYGFMFEYKEIDRAGRLSYTWSQSVQFARWVWVSLGELVHGNVKLNDMAGPVGIVDMMNDVGQSAEETSDAVYSLLYLSAFIAINLAIMNMLPIPALDGGRVFLLLVTLVIEKITRKKLDPKYETYINGVGMLLLLALMAVIMFNDIFKIVSR